jgi:hypothetical protein
MVPTTPRYPGQVSDYDRAIVGPDGTVLQYLKKGEQPPDANTVYFNNINKNREEYHRRLSAGEPTGMPLDPIKMDDFSQPLPPRAAPTPASMAARDRAIQQNIISAPPGYKPPGGAGSASGLPPPPQMTGNKTVDDHNMAVWREQAIAARGSATAAESSMSRDAQAILRNIQNKGGAETEDEKAIEREYTARTRRNLEKMGGQGGAPATGGQPVRVNSLADAMKLQPGTQFIDPNGNLRTR